jgi:hypothetical protein
MSAVPPEADIVFSQRSSAIMEYFGRTPTDTVRAVEKLHAPRTAGSWLSAATAKTTFWWSRSEDGGCTPRPFSPFRSRLVRAFVFLLQIGSHVAPVWSKTGAWLAGTWKEVESLRLYSVSEHLCAWRGATMTRFHGQHKGGSVVDGSNLTRDSINDRARPNLR